MKKIKLFSIIVLTFSGLFLVFYLTPFSSSFDKTFITISTFVFTVFTGFFISRQGNRYSEIRKSVSSVDGNFSSIYRSFGHLGESAQKKAGQIIEIYYSSILESKVWNYNFTHKTTTLVDLHKLLEDVASGTLSPVSNAAVSRVMLCLGNIQIERKGLVAMCEERIPGFQWATIYFLSFVLLFTLFGAIPSSHLLVESLIKAVFATSIVVVIVLLRELDALELFEGVIGEHSARDVIEIIEGKK